jgi:hypothetical protein
VPFKPTQGRPVLCRQCFQAKARALAARPAETVPVSIPLAASATASALQDASATTTSILSNDAAVAAAASMAAAPPQSSVATAADLASISGQGPSFPQEHTLEQTVPASLMAATNGETSAQDLHALSAESPEA